MNQVRQRYGRGLVIGGGIAGPVVAMALQRVGIESTVFEASTVPSDGVGAFLTLASNGLDALQAIDAHRPVVAAGIRTERMILIQSSLSSRVVQQLARRLVRLGRTLDCTK